MDSSSLTSPYCFSDPTQYLDFSVDQNQDVQIFLRDSIERSPTLFEMMDIFNSGNIKDFVYAFGYDVDPFTFDQFLKLLKAEILTGQNIDRLKGVGGALFKSIICFQKRMGLTLTTKQVETLKQITSKNQVMNIMMPTGFGKSTILSPILSSLNTFTIIVVPPSLLKQVLMQLKKVNSDAALGHISLSRELLKAEIPKIKLQLEMIKHIKFKKGTLLLTGADLRVLKLINIILLDPLQSPEKKLLFKDFAKDG